MDGWYGGSAYVVTGAVDHVLGASLAPDYVGVTDLLARWSPDDYATDTAVRRAGIDATKGERHLEEMAFVVANAQRRGGLEARARLLSRRGVRRIFAVFVKEGMVGEWSHMTEAWQVLDSDGVIEDHCLSAPLEVRGLLAAAAVDLAVATALIARGNPVIKEHVQPREATSFRRGYLDAQRKTLHLILAQRRLPPDAQQLARLEACDDPDLLDDWLRRAFTATHADEIFLGRPGRDDALGGKATSP